MAEDQIDENPLEKPLTDEVDLENEGDDIEINDEQEQIQGDLDAQLSEAREQVLRAQADAQNALRRAERDVEKAHKFGQEKLVGDLLLVVDNLERSVAASEEEEASIDSIKEGVALTLKSLIDTLKRHNVEQVDPEGQPFDPALHQAMTMVPSAEQEPNSVLNVFQKGYTLHGRLVRPAMVVVSKAPDGD